MKHRGLYEIIHLPEGAREQLNEYEKQLQAFLGDDPYSGTFLLPRYIYSVSCVMMYSSKKLRKKDEIWFR